MSLVANATRMLEALNYPRAFARALTGRKFSVASHRVAHALAHYQPGFRTILDVGANEGQFALAVAHHFQSAEICAFEPVPDVFECLRRNTRNEPRIRLYDVALGSSSGRIRFYRNRYTQVSSALSIDPDNKQPNYDATAVSCIEVPVARLDDLASHLNLRRPVLLKLDVQGFEREVLLGAERLLGSIDYVLLEMAFVQLYVDQPLFDELDDFLRRLNYRLVAPLGFNEGADRTIIEADMLYRMTV
jgi:FkbM family methyltransferase